MSDGRLAQSVDHLGRAIDRLEEALREPAANSLAVDGTIQRFEFTIELFWKTLRRLLEAHGVRTETPKDTLRKAFQAGWLEDETVWLQMLRDRNETSHAYDESAARRIYESIRHNFPAMRQAFERLRQRLE